MMNILSIPLTYLKILRIKGLWLNNENGDKYGDIPCAKGKAGGPQSGLLMEVAFFMTCIFCKVWSAL